MKATTCKSCKGKVVFLASPFHPAKWRTFEPAPVNGRTYPGVDAYPAEERRTYRFPDLVEALMMRRHCSRAEAEAEAYDVPWWVLHRCPNNDTTDPSGAPQ